MRTSWLLVIFCCVAFASVVNAQDDEKPWYLQPLERPDTLHPDVANKTHFFQWMKDHKKSFHVSEIEHRFSNWKKSVAAIFKQNSRTDSTWVASLNSLSALTKAEFKKLLGARVHNTSVVPQAGDGVSMTDFSSQRKRDRPSWMDWTQKGMVTGVKNQGGCGDCWAFSVAGAFEGGKWLAGRGYADLSSQGVLDCSGAGSCNGGDPLAAARSVAANGLFYDNDYQYRAQQGGCQGGKPIAIRCNNINYVTNGNDNDLANLIAGGPASICFHVNDDFMHYGGGVYDEICDHDINHAVLAVGYAERCSGTQTDCYIVKNQWGTGWGTGGYFLMKMGSNMCGIAGYAHRPDQCWM